MHDLPCMDAQVEGGPPTPLQLTPHCDTACTQHHACRPDPAEVDGVGSWGAARIEADGVKLGSPLPSAPHPLTTALASSNACGTRISRGMGAGTRRRTNRTANCKPHESSALLHRTTTWDITGMRWECGQAVLGQPAKSRRVAALLLTARRRRRIWYHMRMERTLPREQDDLSVGGPVLRLDSAGSRSAPALDLTAVSYILYKATSNEGQREGAHARGPESAPRWAACRLTDQPPRPSACCQ